METTLKFKDDYPHLRKMYEESYGPTTSPENDKVKVNKLCTSNND